jgi:cysteine-rich repeat protein
VSRASLLIVLLAAAAPSAAAAQRILIYGPGGAGSVPWFEGEPEVTVASETEWRAMSTEEFAAHDALWADGGGCSTDPAIFGALVETQDVWGPAVTGRIALNTTDPDAHAPTLAAAVTFIRNHQRWVGGRGATAEGGRTGLYLSTGCVYARDGGPPHLDAYEPTLGGPLDTVFVNGEPDGLVVPGHPLIAGLLLADLRWGVFCHGGVGRAIPPDFTPLIRCPGRYAALYRDAPVCGDGRIERDEVCDDGNTRSCDGCSASCLVAVEDCDDGDGCTADACDAELGCTHDEVPGCRPDAGPDAGLDAGLDAGADAGADAGPDAAPPDGDPPDSGFDAGVDRDPPGCGCRAAGGSLPLLFLVPLLFVRGAGATRRGRSGRGCGRRGRGRDRGGRARRPARRRPSASRSGPRGRAARAGG